MVFYYILTTYTHSVENIIHIEGERMKIISGTGSFLANNTQDQFTPELNQLMKLPEEDIKALMGSKGFVTKSLAKAEDLAWQMDNLTDVYSGSADKIFSFTKMSDINMMLGKQAGYVMAHPALKSSYLDGEIDVPGYYPPDKLIGAEDPIFREIHNGHLIETMSGFESDHFLAGCTTNLSDAEQMKMLGNHRVITNGLSAHLDYLTASGKADVDEDGTVITLY